MSTPPAATGGAAAAAADGALQYTVAPGESLISIARRLLENSSDWTLIASQNHLNRPALLRPGQVLQIPRELLKSTPSQATVEQVSGDARVNREPLVAGQKVGEDSVVETQGDGVVQLRLADGSVLRVSPGSRLRLERLRRYHRDDVIEARTVLEKGRVEAQAAPNRTKPLEIRTPFATAAVRGTDFRVGAQAQNVTSEVLTGKVGWGAPAAARSAQGAPVALDAGYGAAASSRGVTPPEALLPAPDLSQVAPGVASATVRTAFTPVAGAVGYRVSVSPDQDFRSVLAENVVRSAELSFDTRRDGLLYFRVRPVSPTSVEGFDKVARVDVRARPFAPRTQAPADGGITFAPAADARWDPAEQAAGYRVQVAADERFDRILNEQNVDGTGASLRLEPATGERRATRYWRVAGVNAERGYLGPYSAPVALRFYAVPAAPRVLRALVGDVLLGWDGGGDERYLLQLADSNDFARPQLFRPQSPQQPLNTLAPGRYFARLAVVSGDGVTTPYSPAIELRVRDTVRSGAGGGVLESGSGVPIESPVY